MSSDTHIKKFKFDEPELVEEIKQKDKAIRKGKRINDKIEAYQQLLNQQGHTVQQYKDKIVPMFDERIKPQLELGEFQEAQSVTQKNGQVVVTVVDRLEEFKKWYKGELQKKEEQSNQEDNAEDNS